MNIEVLIEQLKKYNWDETNVRIALRAKCECEYCGKNMLESIDNYKLWQIDHIIPKSSGDENCEDFENKALSCTQCNKDFKGKWYSQTVIKEKIDRSKYIDEIKEYIRDKRSKKQKELDEINKLFDNYFTENQINLKNNCV
jgi:5-methylcytosine-specific restriction endonuclease McrA